MRAKVRILLFGLLVLGATQLLPVHAQRFSEDPAIFKNEATGYLRQIGTEAANKVAYDFDNAWNGRFSSSQKERIIKLTRDMRRRGYGMRPYLWHFFSYLAYSVAQERVDAVQLDKVLTINEESLQMLSGREYADYLLGMNVFFARRYLYLSRHMTVQVPGGTYDFQNITFEEVAEEPAPEEPAAALPVEEVYEDPPVEEAAEDDWGSDDWSNDDSWGNDDWGSDDSWDTNDSWDSDDDWGSSDDSWNDDSWSETSSNVEEVVPQRQVMEPTFQDYVALEKSKYQHPQLSGPTIKLRDVQLLLVTRYDSLSIRKVEGYQLLRNQTFAAESGILDWPGQNSRMRGAEVTLTQFSLKVDRPFFNTPNATLAFPGFLNSPTKGVFKYRSVRRPARSLSNFPVFISYEPDLTVNFGNGKAVYKGGLEARGNNLYGASISRKPGSLEILDGNGHKILFRSKKFTFRADSTITSAHASLTIYLNEDSIYHPSVEMEYYINDNKVTILRDKAHNVTPFHSTYHGISINADLIRWYMDSDSITMSIMNGKDLVPASFESDDFFNRSRFRRLTGPYGFHPITVTVNYARKYNITEYVIDELSQEYGIPLVSAKGAVRFLQQYNFCEYNEETGLVKLHEKAFHYYDASAKKVDYDNLFIPSIITRGPNASMSLDSMDIVVNGVKKFYVTTDYHVGIEPEGELVKIGKNRSITYNGAINAGDFLYRGKDFQFDYETFAINMPVIDSIRIQLPPSDSTLTHNNPANKEALSNHLTETSGVLYLDRPDNKSGVANVGGFPYFITDSESIVYFDGEDILDGAYDRSVFFVIPPLEVDSIDREDAQSIQFPGTFNSGDIFPTFDDTLHILDDRSLGFVHQIPEEGYHLYGTDAKTYEEINLSSQGIRGFGQIDFLTSKLFSEDFIYYPDSVTADAYKGEIGPGTLGGASYPQAELGKFRMYWLPRKDSMYLRTVGEPFKFYNQTAELTGEANITTKGVYGSGEILTRGSRAVSNEYNFKELSYSARHAEFEVLTDDPEKPAMIGEDIFLNFDLVKNEADVRPEKVGVAAFSFPYAALNTSITSGTWFLEDSVIVMEKPENVPIEDSYFYSTREELDSLAFSATKASYDINSQEMEVEGIPFIAVADAQIIPEDHRMTVLANSVLQTFQNAEVIFQNDSTYHYLFNATIDVESRRAFSGGATYLLPIGADTFDISFRTFGTESLQLGKDETLTYTAAEGVVPETKNMSIAPGFLFKGVTTLKAYKQALELQGSVKPILESIESNEWVSFSRTDDKTEVVIDFTNATFAEGEKAMAGLHYGARGKVYPTFVEKKEQQDDKDLFVAKGLFKYDGNGQFTIEEPAKTSGMSYKGQTLIYNDSSTAIVFEGKSDFIDKEKNKIEIDASVVGTGIRSTEEYQFRGFFSFDFKMNAATMDLMARDLLDIVERLGNPPANNIEIETLLNLANLTSDEAAKTFETESLKDYVPLNSLSPVLNKSIVVSGVTMKWNKEHNAWHNTTKLGISNVLATDVNAKMDGFLEMKKDDVGADVINLFVQAAPGTWYFFSYVENSLIAFSSNTDFNTAIEDKTSDGKIKEGELVVAKADENETLKFINDFRLKYFGIEEPYNLVYPTEINLEDENFETIETEEEDDGFGF